MIVRNIEMVHDGVPGAKSRMEIMQFRTAFFNVFWIHNVVLSTAFEKLVIIEVYGLCTISTLVVVQTTKFTEGTVVQKLASRRSAPSFVDGKVDKMQTFC